MPNVFKPSVTKVITKDGEVHISLSLDINLNLNAGNLGLSTSVSSQNILNEDDEKVDMVIPEFGPSEAIDFGKKI